MDSAANGSMVSEHTLSHAMSVAVVTTLVLCAGGCGPARSLPEPRAGTAVRRDCPPERSIDYYFEEGALPGKDTSRPLWADVLHQFDVPSLSCGPGTGDAYRLLVVTHTRPTFTVIQVINAEPNAWDVRFGELDGREQKTTSELAARVTEDRVEPLRASVLQSQFFSAPRLATNPYGGADWFLEVREHGGYRVIIRQGIPDDAVGRLIADFFALANLPAPKQLQK